MALGFGLSGVDKGDAATESGFKNLDELGSEGYLWDKEDGGLAFF